MAAANTEFVYEPFADTEEYNTVNSDLIGTWIESLKGRGHEGVDRLLDIATGVGTMAKLFLDNLPTHWSTPTVICLDQSKEALEQAKRNLQGKTTNVELENRYGGNFIVGSNPTLSAICRHNPPDTGSGNFLFGRFVSFFVATSRI